MKLINGSLAGLSLLAFGCGVEPSGGTTVTTSPIAGDAGADGGNRSGSSNGTAAGGSNGSANNGTAGNGSANNGSANNGGTDGSCGGGLVHATPLVPDMMIVLDKSGSMKDTKINRWDPSVEAINAITAATDTVVEFGLMSFPADNDDCGTGKLDVPIELNNAMPIAAALAGMTSGGGTPTATTIKAAHDELMGIMAGPDEIPHPKYLLLVTDGAPGCGGVPPTCTVAQCPKEWADYTFADGVAHAVKAITAAAADKIKTYVIGYDTKSKTSLAAAMNKMAVAGDTGDTEHRAVENRDELVREFQQIAGSVISCEYGLAKAPPDPAYVLVEVDGKQLNLDQADGWTIDGKVVTVQGEACRTLQDGKEHVLSVEVKCEIVPVI